MPIKEEPFEIKGKQRDQDIFSQKQKDGHVQFHEVRHPDAMCGGVLSMLTGTP